MDNYSIKIFKSTLLKEETTLKENLLKDLLLEFYKR
jgi:hypothetical protein